MHGSVTPVAMRNVNVGWVWSKDWFHEGHVDGVHFGDQHTWSTVLAPWLYFCLLNASNGSLQKMDVQQLDLICGDCQSNRGRRWGTQVLRCVIKFVWKIMKWCSSFGPSRLPEQLSWSAMESWCDCRVPIYLQRILFRLRGLREWGGLTTTEAFSLKKFFYSRLCGYSKKWNNQPSLGMVQK